MQNFPRKFFAILNTSLSFVFISYTKTLFIRKNIGNILVFYLSVCSFVFSLFFLRFFSDSDYITLNEGAKRELESGSKQSFRNSKVLSQHLN
jgi:hypothetical protein